MNSQPQLTDSQRAALAQVRVVLARFDGPPPPDLGAALTELGRCQYVLKLVRSAWNNEGDPK